MQIYKKTLKYIQKFVKNSPNSVYSLLYHAVDKNQGNPLTSSNIHNVKPEHFYDQLKQLKKKYTFVWLDEFVEQLRNKKPVKNLITISFDDGYRSVIDNALPILDDLSIPATLYVTASLVKDKVFWRDKIRYIIDKNLINEFLIFAVNKNSVFQSLESENFYKQSKNPNFSNSKEIEYVLDEFLKYKTINLSAPQEKIYLNDADLKKYHNLNFGNHTSNHYVLASLSTEEQYDEILKGEVFLKKRGVEISDIFSIPFGNSGTYNEHTILILEELGYKGCLLSSGNLIKDVFFTHSIKSEKIIFINRFMPKDKFQIF